MRPLTVLLDRSEQLQGFTANCKRTFLGISEMDMGKFAGLARGSCYLVDQGESSPFEEKNNNENLTFGICVAFESGHS